MTLTAERVHRRAQFAESQGGSLTFRRRRVDAAFLRALLERAGDATWLCSGGVYLHEDASRVAWALRRWFKVNRPDMRLSVRLEPVDGGWRLWACVQPRTPGHPEDQP